MALVYIATSPEGKHYVGYTTRTLHRRKREHFRDTRRPGRKLAFHNALLAYGTAFTWQVLADGLDVDLALYLEMAAIAAYRSAEDAYGYNLTAGGDVSPMHHPETRKRFLGERNPMKREENRAKFKGENNPMRREENKAKFRGALNPMKREENRAKFRGALNMNGSHRQRSQRELTAVSDRFRSLTPDQVTNVRILLSLGAYQRECAEWFGVCQPTISDVKNCKGLAYGLAG